MKRLLLFIIAVSLFLCSCSSDAIDSEKNSGTSAIESIIYNYKLNRFIFDSQENTLTIYEDVYEDGLSPDKPQRYKVYEDFMYLYNTYRGVTPILICEGIAEIDPRVIEYLAFDDDNNLSYTYSDFDVIYGYQTPDTPYATSPIDWTSQSGFTLFNIEDLRQYSNTGLNIIIDEKFLMDSKYKSSTKTGKKLSNGYLLDYKITKDGIYGQLTYNSSNRDCIKLDLYDDICSALYKKFPRQICDWEFTFEGRAVLEFGEVTDDYDIIKVTGPDTKYTYAERDVIIEKIANHEPVTYGEVETYLIRSLRGSRALISEDLEASEYYDVNVKY